jgi:hypothetical protein
MSRSHLVIPDAHAHPDHNNDRADYLAQLIIDLHPDVVINMGDCFDMPSLSSYDKGKRSFQGKSYYADISSGNEFQERMWGPVKARKKKLPLRIQLVGNHEHRIEKALDASPELVGTIGAFDFNFDAYNDIVVPYDGIIPGEIEVDGISYSHYFVSGLLGRPIGGLHPAYSLLTKRYASSTAAHSHVLDYATYASPRGWLNSLVAGCYVDYKSSWAGQAQRLWWSGIIFKEEVENGQYDPTFISMKQLQKEYGG